MKTLVIAYKNGRHRKEAEFQISEQDAADPIKRAGIISAKSAGINGNVVNWSIRD